MNHGTKFEGVTTDFAELARKVARKDHIPRDPYTDEFLEGYSLTIREEPNDEDRLEAFRMIVDEAIEYQSKRPHIEAIERMRSTDCAMFERCCLISIGQIPTDIAKMSKSNLFLVGSLIRRIEEGRKL
jgi:hypothetical protein